MTQGNDDSVFGSNRSYEVASAIGGSRRKSMDSTVFEVASAAESNRDLSQSSLYEVASAAESNHLYPSTIGGNLLNNNESEEEEEEEDSGGGGEYDASYFSEMKRDDTNVLHDSANKMNASYNFTSEEEAIFREKDWMAHDFGEYRSMPHFDYYHNNTSASSKIGQTTDKSRSRMFETNSIPFHGREKELKKLQKAVERVSLEWMENPSEVAWIQGPAGVGKSTLIKELGAQEDIWKVFMCRGSCEQHSTASKPFRALTDCLNDLCMKLIEQGGKPLWKSRLDEALGGEGPLLATICPRLCILLETQPMERKDLMTFDANSPHRFERLAFAVRDFLQAVSEFHPVVMIVDNIHWADLDSLQMMQDLLSTKTLQNFLLIGCHDPVAQGHPVQYTKKVVEEATTRVTQISLQGFGPKGIGRMVESIFLEKGEMEDSDAVERVKDLADILFALSTLLDVFTKGTPFWIVSVLRLLNDKKLLVYSDEENRWDWNRKKIKKEVRGWREANDVAFSSAEGVVTRRIELLPKQVKFLVETVAGLRLTFFSVDKMLPIVQAAYSKERKNDEECPISSEEDLKEFIQKACNYGMFKRVSKRGFFKFSHDMVREAAAKLLPTNKNEKVSFVHVRMGAQLSSMCMESRGEERERFKFLSVEQLNFTARYLAIDQQAKLAKLNLEAAEIAISKTAYRTAVKYLETGLSVLPKKIRWEKEYYDTTMRTVLFLARMQFCSHRLSEAKEACSRLFKNAATIKDKVYTNQVLMLVLMEEGDYETAQQEILRYLGMLGEQFPKGETVPGIIDKEINNIRAITSKIPNQGLVNPQRMKDKKSVDVMWLLATLVETCRDRSQQQYRDMATIRMMHISLKSGFSRQYPLSFALFSIILVHRGLIKEAHRLGQVAERVAKMTDFYGGQAVALFHCHVSHWKRTYKRSLEPVLRIYNTQVDSGDFHHVGFSISTYIQYHLASGYDLERLSDNIVLFDGLYEDYDLPDDWQIHIPFEVTSNMLAETQNPLIFFGDTADQQARKISEMESDGQFEGLQNLYFMQCYMAFFFHDIPLMQECLDKLTEKSEGVWIIWRLFFECYVLIQHIKGSKGKQRKELKESIEGKKNQLVDWYNSGSPNPNTLVSLLDIEYLLAKEAGKKDAVSALKAQGMYKEALAAAVTDGTLHLEAFICERAGMHFLANGIHGSASDFLIRAHKLYDQWHAIAKVIDIETKYPGNLLKVDDKRERAAAAYIDHNANIRPSNRTIGDVFISDEGINTRKSTKIAPAKKEKKPRGLRARKVLNIFGKKEHQKLNGDDDEQEREKEAMQQSSRFSPRREKPAKTVDPRSGASNGSANNYLRAGSLNLNVPPPFAEEEKKKPQSNRNLFGRKKKVDKAQDAPPRSKRSLFGR